MNQQDQFTLVLIILGSGVAAGFIIQWCIRLYRKNKQKSEAQKWAEAREAEKLHAYEEAWKLEKDVLPCGQIPYPILKEIEDLGRILMSLGGKPVYEHTFVNAATKQEDIRIAQEALVEFLAGYARDARPTLWEKLGFSYQYPSKDGNSVLNLRARERIEISLTRTGRYPRRTLVIFGWSHNLASVSC